MFHLYSRCPAFVSDVYIMASSTSDPCHKFPDNLIKYIIRLLLKVSFDQGFKDIFLTIRVAVV